MQRIRQVLFCGSFVIGAAVITLVFFVYRLVVFSVIKHAVMEWTTDHGSERFSTGLLEVLHMLGSVEAVQYMNLTNIMLNCVFIALVILVVYIDSALSSFKEKLRERAKLPEMEVINHFCGDYDVSIAISGAAAARRNGNPILRQRKESQREGAAAEEALRDAPLAPEDLRRLEDQRERNEQILQQQREFLPYGAEPRRFFETTQMAAWGEYQAILRAAPEAAGKQAEGGYSAETKQLLHADMDSKIPYRYTTYIAPGAAPVSGGNQKQQQQQQQHLRWPLHGTAGIVMDLDGVVHRGGQLIPGSDEAIRLLQELKVPLVFMTNGGCSSEASKAVALSEMLGCTIHPAQVLLSHSPMRLMAPLYRHKRVLIVGEPECAHVAREYGFAGAMSILDYQTQHPEMVPYKKWGGLQCARPGQVPFPEVAAIFQFNDPDDPFNDIQTILDLLTAPYGQPGSYVTGTQSLPYYASADDLLWATEAPLPRLGQGAFREMLSSVYESVTGGGIEVTMYGKPRGIAYAFAEQRLKMVSQSLGWNPEDLRAIFMVGDNVETDIVGANAAGGKWTSVYVLSGVGRAPAARRTLAEGDTEHEWLETCVSHVPHYVAPTVDHFVRELLAFPEAAVLQNRTPYYANMGVKESRGTASASTSGAPFPVSVTPSTVSQRTNPLKPSRIHMKRQSSGTLVDQSSGTSAVQSGDEGEPLRKLGRVASSTLNENTHRRSLLKSPGNQSLPSQQSICINSNSTNPSSARKQRGVSTCSVTVPASDGGVSSSPAHIGGGRQQVWKAGFGSILGAPSAPATDTAFSLLRTSGASNSNLNNTGNIPVEAPPNPFADHLTTPLSMSREGGQVPDPLSSARSPRGQEDSLNLPHLRFSDAPSTSGTISTPAVSPVNILRSYQGPCIPSLSMPPDPERAISPHQSSTNVQPRSTIEKTPRNRSTSTGVADSLTSRIEHSSDLLSAEYLKPLEARNSTSFLHGHMERVQSRSPAPTHSSTRRSKDPTQNSFCATVAGSSESRATLSVTTEVRGQAHDEAADGDTDTVRGDVSTSDHVGRKRDSDGQTSQADSSNARIRSSKKSNDARRTVKEPLPPEEVKELVADLAHHCAEAVKVAELLRENATTFRYCALVDTMRLYHVLGLEDDEHFRTSNKLQKRLRRYRFPPPDMEGLRGMPCADQRTIAYMLGGAEMKRRERVREEELLLNNRGRLHQFQEGMWEHFSEAMGLIGVSTDDEIRAHRRVIYVQAHRSDSSSSSETSSCSSKLSCPHSEAVANADVKDAGVSNGTQEEGEKKALGGVPVIPTTNGRRGGIAAVVASDTDSQANYEK